jgi:hypothetical protein
MAMTGMVSPGYGAGPSQDPHVLEGHDLIPEFLQDINMASTVGTTAWSLDDWCVDGIMAPGRDNGFWPADAPSLPPVEARSDRPRDNSLHGSPPLTNYVSVNTVQGSMQERHSLSIPLGYESLHQCVSRFSHVFSPTTNINVAAPRPSSDSTLAVRRTPTHQFFLISQALLGQISKYPQMLLQARLPPFIHPTCVLEGRLASSCAREGHHACLPEPLAICSSMIRMISYRGTHSCSFIWKMIMEQQAQLVDNVSWPASLFYTHLPPSTKMAEKRDSSRPTMSRHY